MPNWCNNEMTISHPDPYMIQRAADAWNRDEFLNDLIPEPKEIQANEKGGQMPDWWHWRIANWGVKWDVADVYFEHQAEEDSIQFSFSTAWGPPVEAFTRWAESDGRVQFTLEYWEPGMAFAGRTEWDGESLSDDHRDLQTDPQGYRDLAAEVFGYVEDEEPEPLTQWYKAGVEEKGLA